jgi:pyruvate kinase
MSDNQIKTNLEWISTLSVDRAVKNIRKTSIICTIGTLFLQHYYRFIYFIYINFYSFDIGPKTNNADMMKKLRGAGMNIVRMNFSHGSYEVCVSYKFVDQTHLYSFINLILY